MFYTFHQNNSFGRFVYDAARGITNVVVIEADDVDEAVSRAETIGLYFDGEGDCPCCGDRWSKPWREDGTEGPESYGTPLHKKFENNDQKWKHKWIEGGPEAVIHYKDGRMEWMEED